MKHQAILELYPEVKVIHEDVEGNLHLCDGDGNPVSVTLDETAINNKVAELESGKEWADLRSKRNQLLAETDYLALSDVTLSSEMTTYRQALRDLPSNTTDPANPTWPTKPS
tara:strand:+ start:1646 stop:1981 length:336 start_codon:yes stop_codon:yes gene_type:complete